MHCKPGSPKLYSSTSKFLGINKLKTSEITTLQAVVSVIQNMNFSWAFELDSMIKLYTVRSTISATTAARPREPIRSLGLPKALPAAIPDLLWGHPSDSPPYCLPRCLCTYWELFLSAVSYPTLTRILVRRSEKKGTDLPGQQLQRLSRRFKKISCYHVMIYLPPISADS